MDVSIPSGYMAHFASQLGITDYGDGNEDDFFEFFQLQVLLAKMGKLFNRI